MLSIHTAADAQVTDGIRSEMERHLGHLQPRTIVLKPNWVLHESNPAFPIRALVTSPQVIHATLQACLDLFPSAQSILVGDCPLQWADWPLLCQQSGLDTVIRHFAQTAPGRVAFRDLRREVFQREASHFLAPADTEHGDPRGYREVQLGKESHLEPIADQSSRFAVSDYDTSVTSSHHAPGCHQYLVSQSILDADLFINLPKWKCHAKSGLTAALKNVVGINGDKAYLPHFRRGAPRWGGDEYRDEDRWLYWSQSTLKNLLQKRSQTLYRALKPGWELLKRWRGIETKLQSASDNPGRFYSGSGSWHGNQTIWRMIYDLNLIIRWVDAQGTLQPHPVRDYFCIVDGLVSGEGNGPLEPLPRDTGWLVFGSDPFAIDATLAWAMGFQLPRLPILEHRHAFLRPDWGRFDSPTLSLLRDGQTVQPLTSPPPFQFVPPPGWKGHLER